MTYRDFTYLAIGFTIGAAISVLTAAAFSGKSIPTEEELEAYEAMARIACIAKGSCK